MNSYQQEQLEALSLVREKLSQFDEASVERLRCEISTYLEFRRELQRFMDKHMGQHCTHTCFASQTSACCSRDGIITFWADVVINAIQSGDDKLKTMAASIQRPWRDEKCIYLSGHGCQWEIKPLLCAMFICDEVQTNVIQANPKRTYQWELFRNRAKAFRWPDSPVLFDKLEMVFMDSGCRSPLMYINSSPGLMRIKQKAGI